ncbi:hypothetical protein GYMLUDRAFT_32709 [Collybiopsis luxurians FD-317 M1]|nr:hypothetical protein GYMLUDRAFT_32709 [Collybiopsis luxurians FD-317 M1]
MNTPNLPTLPKIDGDVDLTLAVFTHPSLSGVNPGTNPSQYDSDRLAEMGKQVLELATTTYLYSKRPFLNANDIRLQREVTLDENRIILWLEHYGLKTKLRAAPEYRVHENLQEMKKYFCTYVGAVYVTSGLKAVENWIAQLADPNAEPPQSASSSTPLQQPPQYYPNPPAPSSEPPPLPSAAYQAPPSNPTITNSLAWLTLSTVNQTAAQKHVSISYPADPPVGPSHSPTWTVHCLIDGQERGIGTGKSQKIAKEEAARQAYINMGW